MEKKQYIFIGNKHYCLDGTIIEKGAKIELDGKEAEALVNRIVPVGSTEALIAQGKAGEAAKVQADATALAEIERLKAELAAKEVELTKTKEELAEFTE